MQEAPDRATEFVAVLGGEVGGYKGPRATLGGGWGGEHLPPLPHTLRTYTIRCYSRCSGRRRDRDLPGGPSRQPDPDLRALDRSPLVREVSNHRAGLDAGVCVDEREDLVPRRLRSALIGRRLHPPNLQPTPFDPLDSGIDCGKRASSIDRAFTTPPRSTLSPRDRSRSVGQQGRRALGGGRACARIRMSIPQIPCCPTVPV